MGLMGRGNVDIMQMLSKAQDEYDKVRCLYVSLGRPREGDGSAYLVDILVQEKNRSSGSA